MKDYIKAFIMPATVAMLLILGMVLFGAPAPQPAPVEAPKTVKADYYPSTAPPSAPPAVGGIRMDMWYDPLCYIRFDGEWYSSTGGAPRHFKVFDGEIKVAGEIKKTVSHQNYPTEELSSNCAQVGKKFYTIEGEHGIFTRNTGLMNQYELVPLDEEPNLSFREEYADTQEE